MKAERRNHLVLPSDHVRYAVVVCASLYCILLSACSSGMTTADCQSANWSALALEDGQLGRSFSSVEKRAGACADAGFTPDPATYRAAYHEGLTAYCTEEGGFEAGARGDKYRKVCSHETEAGFLTGYMRGEMLFDLTKKSKESQEDYEEAVEALDRNRYNLVISKNRYENPTLTNEDREIARLDIEFHEREIDRLTRDVPRLQKKSEEAAVALEAFQAEVKQD